MKTTKTDDISLVHQSKIRVGDVIKQYPNRKKTVESIDRMTKHGLVRFNFKEEGGSHITQLDGQIWRYY